MSGFAKRSANNLLPTVRRSVDVDHVRAENDTHIDIRTTRHQNETSDVETVFFRHWKSHWVYANIYLMRVIPYWYTWRRVYAMAVIGVQKYSCWKRLQYSLMLFIYLNFCFTATMSNPEAFQRVHLRADPAVKDFYFEVLVEAAKWPQLSALEISAVYGECR